MVDNKEKDKFDLGVKGLTHGAPLYPVYKWVLAIHKSVTKCNSCNSKLLKSPLQLELDKAHDPSRLEEGSGSLHCLLFPWCKLYGQWMSTHWFLVPSICWQINLTYPASYVNCLIRIRLQITCTVYCA